MATKVYTRVKIPEELLDYQISWKRRLKNDAIVDSTWAVEAGDTSQIVIDHEGQTESVATVWVSGGLDKKTAKLRNTIVTDLGRTMIQSVAINIRKP